MINLLVRPIVRIIIQELTNMGKTLLWEDNVSCKGCSAKIFASSAYCAYCGARQQEPIETIAPIDPITETGQTFTIHRHTGSLGGPQPFSIKVGKNQRALYAYRDWSAKQPQQQEEEVTH